MPISSRVLTFLGGFFTATAYYLWKPENAYRMHQEFVHSRGKELEHQRRLREQFGSHKGEFNSGIGIDDTHGRFGFGSGKEENLESRLGVAGDKALNRSDSFQNTRHSSNNRLNDASDNVRKAFDDAASGGARLRDGVLGRTSDYSESMNKRAEKANEDLKNQINGYRSDVRGAVDGAGKSFEDSKRNFRDSLDNAKQSGREVVSRISDGANDITKRGSKTIQDNSELKDNYEKLKSDVESSTNQASDYGKDLYNKVSNAVEDMGEKGSKAIKDTADYFGRFSGSDQNRGYRYEDGSPKYHSQRGKGTMSFPDQSIGEQQFQIQGNGTVNGKRFSNASAGDQERKSGDSFYADKVDRVDKTMGQFKDKMINMEESVGHAWDQTRNSAIQGAENAKSKLLGLGSIFSGDQVHPQGSWIQAREDKMKLLEEQKRVYDEFLAAQNDSRRSTTDKETKKPSFFRNLFSSSNGNDIMRSGDLRRESNSKFSSGNRGEESSGTLAPTSVPRDDEFSKCVRVSLSDVMSSTRGSIDDSKAEMESRISQINRDAQNQVESEKKMLKKASEGAADRINQIASEVQSEVQDIRSQFSNKVNKETSLIDEKIEQQRKIWEDAANDTRKNAKQKFQNTEVVLGDDAYKFSQQVRKGSEQIKEISSSPNFDFSKIKVNGDTKNIQSENSIIKGRSLENGNIDDMNYQSGRLSTSFKSYPRRESFLSRIINFLMPWRSSSGSNLDEGLGRFAEEYRKANRSADGDYVSSVNFDNKNPDGRLGGILEGEMAGRDFRGSGGFSTRDRSQYSADFGSSYWGKNSEERYALPGYQARLADLLLKYYSADDSWAREGSIDKRNTRSWTEWFGLNESNNRKN